jgi:hypothetical protein
MPVAFKSENLRLPVANVSLLSYQLLNSNLR